VVLLVVLVVVVWHSGQPLQNQLPQATPQPPDVDSQRAKHCPVVVNVVPGVAFMLNVDVVFVLVVEILVVEVVVWHCGHDAQNHWPHASSQPPPNVWHKNSWHSAVVVEVLVVVVGPPIKP
jgi:hypothetical protein